ncbi:putative flagellar hook-associated protein [Desulfamplus magnetovallimortis]|uniref:Flagellar hook-associated protein 1 n=1 Tax=Desulfamplus magnetovallimortis TaxID=1246637 RepID=A0A1W1H9U9_9BACT|nr:flagellar hook-associated protein FlgK [Desulfamplus magnetovallimortis]SLM29216.1 putative flagellar hook-associated protein [Desulfamplus magnetovallimortis]
MSGLGSTLHIAKDALAANQYGLNVTGNNIANVNNPDYSRQTIEQINKGPVPYAGFLFGSGVDSSQITQSVNQLLENRLTGEKASLAGYEEADYYVRIIADHFNESSENSISNIMTDFWNSWNDLSNNPADDSERLIVLENGQELAERFSMAYDYLDRVGVEISNKLINAVDRINDITADIAELNEDIMGQETQRTSNDKRDQRNALIDELGKLIAIDTFEQPSGAVVVNVANGFPIVNGNSTYDLSVKNNQIAWHNSAGGSQIISDKITGGQIGGWLDVREEVIPKYQAEIDELSHEVVWAINYQHSIGAGLEYFSDSITGTYAVDESGWLTSLSYGEKIDHSENLTMWIEDKTDADPVYSKIEMDMGISEAKISNWQAGADLLAEEAVYKLTVLDGTTIGNSLVSQSDGQKIGVVPSGYAVDARSVMMDPSLAPIAEQNIIIAGGPSGKEIVEIKYAGGDAKQSAASIAEALSKVDGVTAYASETSVILDVASAATGIAPLSPPPPADGETVSFGIYVDGITHYETFEVDSTSGGLQEQYEDAFLAAVEAINDIYGDDDLRLEYDSSDASNTEFRMVSSSGRTIGLEGFDISSPVPAPGAFISFSGNGTTAVQVDEGGAPNMSAVVTGTLTIETDPDISISSSVDGAAGGLFAVRRPTFGSSIMTLGGEGGFQGFDAGDTITFTIDGTHAVTVAVPGAAVTDQDFADALYLGLTTTTVPPLTSTPPVSSDDYAIIQNGLSVSIIKNKDLETPIEITAFTDDLAGNPASSATLNVKTGTGKDTNSPENDILDSANPLRNFSTSSLYEDEGVILWEKYDTNGNYTGKKGLITVEDAEEVAIIDDTNGGNLELLKFDISAGSLVAGNTLSINVNETTDSSGNDIGVPDPLDFTIRGNANSQNEIYRFKATSGGTIGTLPRKDESFITIEWDNGINSGSFEIEEHDPPLTPSVPVEVEVDGMTLMFSSGTLLAGDVFTVTTDEGGKPVSTNSNGKATGELLSDWHWTLDSFADEFNRRGQGMTASVNRDNQLVIGASDSYHVVDNIAYSESNGFKKDNLSIKINDWSSMDFEATRLQFSRTASGDWNIINDPTGGNAQFLPAGADDDIFGVDFSGDGIADISLIFEEKPSGAGNISFDLVKHDADDIGFAFSDASGMIAAAGINTFYKGDSAWTMELDETIRDTNFLAAATIDPDTGEIHEGDNSNTLAMANLQFQSLSMKQWAFSRGEEPESSMTTATLDGYYSTMLGSLGVDSRNIQSAREFSNLMVNYITEERDSVSAVSLDEEMIKLMEYQNAFAAASKLVSVADEMLNTIIALK